VYWPRWASRYPTDFEYAKLLVNGFETKIPSAIEVEEWHLADKCQWKEGRKLPKIWAIGKPYGTQKTQPQNYFFLLHAHRKTSCDANTFLACHVDSVKSARRRVIMSRAYWFAYDEKSQSVRAVISCRKSFRISGGIPKGTIKCYY